MERPNPSTHIIQLLIVVAASSTTKAQSVNGNVSDLGSTPLQNARVTIYNSDTSFFAEDRTDASGNYLFMAVPGDVYTVNASRADLAFQRITINTNGVDPFTQDLVVSTDTIMGQWNVLVNSPEPLGGTNLCTLLPDGRLFYCHNTTDPFVFDHATNLPQLIPGAGAVQGCVGLAMRTDSAIVFIGGADQDVYGPGTTRFGAWTWWRCRMHSG